MGSAEIGFIKDAPRPRFLPELTATGRAFPRMRLAELLDPDRRAILSTERRGRTKSSFFRHANLCGRYRGAVSGRPDPATSCLAEGVESDWQYGVEFGFSEPSEHLAVYGKGRLPPLPSKTPIVPRKLFISPILRKFLFREIARIAEGPVAGRRPPRFWDPLPLDADTPTVAFRVGADWNFAIIFSRPPPNPDNTAAQRSLTRGLARIYAPARSAILPSGFGRRPSSISWAIRASASGRMVPRLKER